MSKYLSIEFEGPASNLSKFFESKGWNFEIKNIFPHKIFVKVSDELADEVKFFEGTPIDDSKEDKITTIKMISEGEYNNTAENGFEIIHAQGDAKRVVESNQPIISSNIINQQVRTAPTNEIGFPLIAQSVPAGSQVGAPQTAEEVRHQIATALTNTILPSKSPLSADDPFAFLTSQSYLRNFAVASTVLLFLIALFD